MVERVRITPTDMTLRNAGGGVVFSTDYRYIKTDPSGNMQLTPTASTPINYVTQSYWPAPGRDVIVANDSGINILNIFDSATGSLSVTGPAFPTDGNLVFGPQVRFAYYVGSVEGPASLYNTGDATYAPFFANVYSGSRYIGTLRLQAWRIMAPSSGASPGQIGIGWNIYMRTSESALGTTGIIHSTPVYKGERVALVRSGPVSIASQYAPVIAGGIRLDFNSGTSTIALKVTA